MINNQRQPTILVTGGAGYVGSHACKALAEAGYLPITFDNLSRGHRWAVQWGPLVQGDLLNPSDLERVFAEYQPSAVLHFASLAYVGESMTRPQDYYRINVAGSLGLLDAMRASSCRAIVFSSTCATYGVPNSTPIDESIPQNPINPYGRTKLMVEQMLRDHHRAHGISFIALRYFNAAGADPECRIGECHNPETHLIPLTLEAAMGRSPQVSIFGSDYDTPDGTCIRDYVHVEDLAQAHLAALESLLQNDQTADAYNLGTGSGSSVLEVIDICERITGHSITRQFEPRRAGDPARLVAANERAKRKLHWEPKMSQLSTIIESAWRWQKKIE